MRMLVNGSPPIGAPSWAKAGEMNIERLLGATLSTKRGLAHKTADGAWAGPLKIGRTIEDRPGKRKAMPSPKRRYARARGQPACAHRRGRGRHGESPRYAGRTHRRRARPGWWNRRLSLGRRRSHSRARGAGE